MLILKGLLGDHPSIFLKNSCYESKRISDSIVQLLKKDCAQNLISIFHLLKNQNLGKTEKMTHLNFYSEAIFKLLISLSKTKKKRRNIF